MPTPQAPLQQRWIVVRGSEVLVEDRDGVPQLPSRALAEPWADSWDNNIFLGRLAESECYAVVATANVEPAGNLRFTPVRSLFGALDEGTLYVIGKAIALTEFE